MYNEQVMDHFKNPRNQGSIPNADGIGEVGNPVCGDMMKIYIKVKKPSSASSSAKASEDEKATEGREEIIEDIKFETLGCGAAIATSSMLTELAKGKPIDEAVKITRQDIADALGGLPQAKIHCSVLAADGLVKAVEDYRVKHANK
jgi:nitrogen fixation NifU-like protein